MHVSLSHQTILVLQWSLLLIISVSISSMLVALQNVKFNHSQENRALDQWFVTAQRTDTNTFQPNTVCVTCNV